MLIEEFYRTEPELLLRSNVCVTPVSQTDMAIMAV